MSNLLVIEDDRFFADDLIYFLRDAGHTCDYAHDADTALSFIENVNKYDQVTLDLMMHKGTKLEATQGESTGAGLFREIRNRNGKIPVLVITAKSVPEVEELVRNDPFTQILTKPVTDIKNLVSEWIK